MIDIDTEHEVDSPVGEIRVGRPSEHRLNVAKTDLVAALHQHLQHLSLDVDCIDLALGAHEFGKFERVEAIPTAEVTDGFALLDLEGFEEQAAVFFTLPAFTHQPWSTREVHRLRDLAAHEVSGRRRVWGQTFLSERRR